jgi:hypothetical protein
MKRHCPTNRRLGALATLMVVAFFQLGCSKGDSSPDKRETTAGVQREDNQSTTLGIQQRKDPITGLDLGITEVDEKFELSDVNKENVGKIYISFATWYHGSDANYHYILHRVHDTVFRIARSEISDEQLLKLYREKIARDRSKIPGPGSPHRTKEFLDWLKVTKIERIAGIDKKEDW